MKSQRNVARPVFASAFDNCLTDAERETGIYSNRFAAHIVRQHQLNALFEQRGWRYDLQGEGLIFEPEGDAELPVSSNPLDTLNQSLEGK